MSNNTKKIPPIVQAGAWLLSLIVFAVGFWHTYLGLKEMHPFGSEKGGLAIAAIVLLLILITYWFAVNGKKIALVFYILCGMIFFVCNLNYFYPSYMARTLIKEEASDLKNIIDSYSKVNPFSKSITGNTNKLSEYRDEIKTQIETDGGFGDVANEYLNKFNQIAGTLIDRPNDLKLTIEAKNNLLSRLDKAIQEWQIREAGKDGYVDAASLYESKSKLDSLSKFVSPKLQMISTDDQPIIFDSIKNNPKIHLFEQSVEEINGAVVKMNTANKKVILKELDKNVYPNSSKLGEIQNTLTTIGKRLNQISTWAIIILCLFIDLIVPLAIYILLRKKEDDPEENTNKPKGPVSF
jgi:flagellar biosynthesis chaperone FliJ